MDIQATTGSHLIKSKDNDFFKRVKSYAQAKYRRRDNCLIAEGEKLYKEALLTLKLKNTIASQSYLAHHPEDFQNLTIFADSLFDSVSELKTNQGILGIFEIPSFDLDMTALSKVVVLEGIQDPKNLGAIIRSAHCLGYQAVFVNDGCAQAFSPKAIRSSMGSVFHLPVIAASTAEQLQELKNNDFALVATALSGKEDLPQFEKVALVIGSEGSGLSKETLELCDYVFRIKMHGGAESLNAAVASGIAMYLFAGTGAGTAQD